MSFLLYDDEFLARGIKGAYTDDTPVALNPVERLLFWLVKAGMAACQIVIFVICKIPLLSSLFETFARSYSRGALGFFLRGAYCSNRLKKMGRNVFLDLGVTIWQPENVEIGDGAHIDTYVTILGGAEGHGSVRIGKYVHVASYCVLSGRGGVTIGDYCAVAAGSKIYSGSNYHTDPDHPDAALVSMSAAAPMRMQYVVEKPVNIEEYAFISLNSVILPGVTVGKATVIGAGSVVNGDIPPFSIAVGSPAKVVKQRPQPGVLKS